MAEQACEQSASSLPIQRRLRAPSQAQRRVLRVAAVEEEPDRFARACVKDLGVREGRPHRGWLELRVLHHSVVFVVARDEQKQRRVRGRETDAELVG